MALSTQPVKGARDFYPEDMRLQKYIFSTWRKVCESFGYEEYDSPILEPTELYLSKGNEEIVQEQTYTFRDRGDRSVTLRTEMTPSVSRMVAARRQEAPYPLRWYSIPQCWRYERMQRGRGREFYQLNVDVFGITGLEADFELIQIADKIMQEFGAKREMYSIRLNSRKLVDELLASLGFDETQAQTARRLIDRKSKMDYPAFVAQLDATCSPSQRETGMNERLLNFLKLGSIAEVPEDLAKSASVMSLQKVFAMLEKTGMSNAVFDPTLMRGFDYYTDIAFEVFDSDPENNRSMFGGGRYDGLVEMFGVESLSAAGFAMGDITLQNFLQTHGLVPSLRPSVDLAVLLVGNVFEAAQNIIDELREMDVRVSVDSTGRKAEKQIKSADKKDIRYVLFIGDKELESDQLTLKDLKTGSEETHGLERIASVVRDFRES